MKLDNPCIGVCKFDAATGMCKACFRTRDERKTWKSVSDDSRAEIIALRPERERALIAAGVAITPSKPKKDKKKGEKKRDKKESKKKDKKSKQKADETKMKKKEKKEKKSKKAKG